jgi:hypothetical protein
MTLNAQLSGCLEGYQMEILSPVGPMATDALHCKILVPLINKLVAHRVGLMLLPVVTLPAQLNGRLLSQKQDIVGCMGIVADGAHPLSYRRMFRGRYLLPFQRVRMALPAKLLWRILEEVCLRRCMRAVAVETSSLADNGPVKPVLGKHVIDQTVMTPPAQFKTILSQG